MCPFTQAVPMPGDRSRIGSGTRYNGRVATNLISINPLPLLIVVAGTLVVILALIVRRRM